MSALGNFQHANNIDKRAKETLLKPDARLDNAITNSRKHGLPEITVSSLAGQFLSIQCHLINAKSVLEIGTLGGYSTIWFASTGAKVTSIELNPKHRDVALENCKGLDVDVILGSAVEVLPELANNGKKFDFVFVDADWGRQAEYFQWATKLTRPGGCIYVDNVVRELLETDPEGKRESLLTKVGREKKVQATLISTIGSHKQIDNAFDGFLLAVVKE